ncbi:hypothetical protein BDR05DRAFT_495944 [Suillus weaverae]|nr:hypothetical protein BDR05DRAFT_495944 [Suillus weaverae]
MSIKRFRGKPIHLVTHDETQRLYEHRADDQISAAHSPQSVLPSIIIRNGIESRRESPSRQQYLGMTRVRLTRVPTGQHCKTWVQG